MQKDEWTYIVTETNEAGTAASVLFHCDTASEAANKTRFLQGGGYEGPVKASLYPIGAIIKTEDYPG